LDLIEKPGRTLVRFDRFFEELVPKLARVLEQAQVLRSKTMKPNIFSFDTSELSQAAFFTWLLQWGDNSNEKFNKELHAVAQRFISTLVGEEITINTVRAGRQWKNIDIWAEINDDIFITIEDKTNTSDYSEQLEKYKKSLRDYYKETRSKLYFIFVKTGNESLTNLEQIEYDGYKIINRKILLEILNSRKVDDGIFNDFLHNLISIEAETNRYNKLSDIIKYRRAGEGFYCKLQENINKERPNLYTNWEYVANKAGGFIGFWYEYCTISWDKDNTQYDGLYIQIENRIGRGINLVIKICDWNQKANFLHRLLQELSVTAKSNGIHLVKPKVFRPGKTSTVAMVNNAFLTDKDDNFDFTNFMNTLRKVEKTFSDYADEREKAGKMPGRALFGRSHS
jgi:hypothetical protein